MEYLNLISVPAIAMAVYLLIEVLKKVFNNNEKFLRLIPLISLTIGVIIGGASGLTATGTNQIVKQLTKEKEE